MASIAHKGQVIMGDNGVMTFNGRSGSVLPVAGDYSAEQVNYDSNQTVKQKIDALVTKEASDIAGQQSLLKDTVGWTGKNLLKNIATSQTINGVTFTVNADKSVTVNGTATSLTNINFTEAMTSDKELIFSLGANSSSTTFKGFITASGGSGDIADTGNSGSVKFTTSKTFFCHMVVYAGATFSNVTVYPMLRKADITDPTYEPYHESVETMYEEEIHGVNLLKIVREMINGRGMAITRNSDNSYTFNGTASTDVGYVSINDRTVNLGAQARLKNGSYKMSGFPAGITSPNVYMIAAITKNGQRTVLAAIYGNSTDKEPTFIVNGDDYGSDGAQVNLSMYVNADYAVTNLVFRPMIRKADIEDSTYRPYNPQAIQNQLNAQGVLGAKNLLKVVTTSQTVNGVTFTINRDNNGNVLNVTVNGTASAGTECNLCSTADYISQLIPEGDYIISDGGVGASNNARLNVARRKGASGTTNNIAVYGDTPIRVDYSEYDYYKIIIWMPSGATANNLTFKPMIRLASDPDGTYQPYTMTNRELTENIFLKQGDISSSNDLNNIKEDGIYAITTAPTHSPESAAYYILIVKKYAENQLIQVIHKHDVMYSRRYFNNSGSFEWSPWYKFTGTEVS